RDFHVTGVQTCALPICTDSVNISSAVQHQARDVIARTFGDEYVPEKPPFYRTRSKGAQEAHEAIRPTDPSRDPASIKARLSGPQIGRASCRERVERREA